MNDSTDIESQFAGDIQAALHLIEWRQFWVPFIFNFTWKWRDASTFNFYFWYLRSYLQLSWNLRSDIWPIMSVPALPTFNRDILNIFVNCFVTFFILIRFLSVQSIVESNLSVIIFIPPTFGHEFIWIFLCIDLKNSLQKFVKGILKYSIYIWFFFQECIA